VKIATLTIFRVGRLAQVLSKQSIVIVAVIAPFADTRRRIDELIWASWILCRRLDQKERIDLLTNRRK